MKHILRIVSVVLVLCLLAVPLSGCTSQRQPLVYLKSAIERSFEKSLGGEMAALLGEALNGGSVSFTWQGEGDLGGVTAADATFYFDAEQKKIMTDTVLSLGEKSYDAKLWLAGESVVASSTAFFGSTTLGVNLGTLKTDLEHSIFRNNSGTAYAVPEIDESSADEVLTLVKGFFSLYTSMEDIADLLDEHVENFLKYLTEYARYTRYSEDGKWYVYLSVDNSMLSRALRDTWSKAVKDNAFCRRVREVAKTHDAMQSATEGVVSTAWTTIVENWLQNNAEIEALCARIDAAEPFTLELHATVKKLTGALLSFSFTYQTKEKSTAFSLDLTQKDVARLSLLYGGLRHDLELKTVEDGWRTYAADFTYTQTDPSSALAVWHGNFTLDNKQSTFVLSLTQNDRTKVFNGGFSCDGDGFSFSVDSLREGERELGFSCSLSVAASAEMPDTPEYVNLPTVTEQRIDPVAVRARETFALLKADFNKEAITKDSVIDYLLAPFRFE